MAIIDLTGTSWELNSSIDVQSILYTLFYIDFDFNNLTYYSLQSDMVQSGPPLFASVYRFIFYSENNNNYVVTQGGSTILTTSNEIISITGGDDATNTDLINWLQANATQIQTGYSITYHSNGGLPVPADLSDQTTLPDQLPQISKDNYSFVGWYYDDTFTTEAHGGDELTSNVNLYAKFVRSVITLDLSTIGLMVSEHSIQMRLSDDYTTKWDSDFSNAVTYTVTSAYSITPTLIRVVPDSNNPTSINPGETALLKFTAESEYRLPPTITVQGADATWSRFGRDDDRAELYLRNATDNVSFTIEATHTAQVVDGLVIAPPDFIPTELYAEGMKQYISRIPDTIEGAWATFNVELHDADSVTARIYLGLTQYDVVTVVYPDEFTADYSVEPDGTITIEFNEDIIITLIKK